MTRVGRTPPSAPDPWSGYIGALKTRPTKASAAGLGACPTVQLKQVKK
jgi:hypothetical protein